VAQQSKAQHILPIHFVSVLKADLLATASFSRENGAGSRWHIIITIVIMLRHAVDARFNFFPPLIRIGKWSVNVLVRLTTEIQGQVHIRQLIVCVEHLQSTKHRCEPRIENEPPPLLCVCAQFVWLWSTPVATDVVLVLPA